MQTEEEFGTQHQGMDRPGKCQVPEGSEEQRKMEKSGCKIVCGAPTTLAVKRLMMMMMKTDNMKRNLHDFSVRLSKQQKTVAAEE